MGMIDLVEYYEVKIEKNKMSASIIQHKKREEGEEVTSDQLIEFLKEHGVIYGIDGQAIIQVVSTLFLTEPAILATGLSPVAGKPAYLQPIQFVEKDREIETNQNLDLRDVLEIPAVKIGEKIGEKIPATSGTDGYNVFGELIETKPGRDMKVRKGKNSRYEEDTLTFYSLIDGQISLDKYTIHVHPTYEVRGDLSMKTGNIDFIGNVLIRGNVPAGFEVKAGGDIKVTGTVEAAKLVAGGSIFIGAGVVGQHKSYLEAKGDLETTFINEGEVRTGGKIEVVQAILHSTCKAGTIVVCQRGKGLIVGGSISAAESISANEIGNAMQTKTELFVGLSEETLKEHHRLEVEKKSTEENLHKLGQLLKVYITKEKESGPFTGKEKLSKLRVVHTYKEASEKLEQLKQELEDLQEDMKQDESGFVIAERALYPNVSLNFGKYRRKITAPFKRSKITLTDSEIVISTN
ncbi:DUF342 domain-containing protein [Bacillus sp. YZJH907-2]|uniref:DUF342 domain-containing protein n=2 Tax=Halalkalibacter suaedae TaxID=2822140 RepID=A0A940WUK0_9BACI|nr:DUF342 domain-containing protein [Bacillus suaedae]